MKLKIRNLKENYEIERAIKFLVHQFGKCGNATKPVILHSIHVGLYLYDLGYPQKIIIAGILHDLLEDTDTTYNEIKKEFGHEVSQLVKVNSYNSKNPDKTKRCIEMYDACKKTGKDALIVKSADILKNLPYLRFAKDKETIRYCLKVWKYFLDISKTKVGREKVYKNLEKKFDKVLKLNH